MLRLQIIIKLMGKCGGKRPLSRISVITKRENVRAGLHLKSFSSAFFFIFLFCTKSWDRKYPTLTWRPLEFVKENIFCFSAMTRFHLRICIRLWLRKRPPFQHFSLIADYGPIFNLYPTWCLVWFSSKQLSFQFFVVCVRKNFGVCALFWK